LSRRPRRVQTSKEEQYEGQQLLNNKQSETLITWLNNLTERGLPPSYEMLRNFAKEISGTKPGKHWSTRFLKKKKKNIKRS
jgi:Tc5 transposase DNA-binding domain